MMLVDSHTHLDQYAPSEITGILERAQQAHVSLIVCASTTLESSHASLALSGQYAPIYAGVGIHPAEATSIIDNATYEGMRSLALSSPKVVCISETGLDFLPTSPDRSIQDQVFRHQIRLARELGLPIIFHSRESHQEVFRLLAEEKAWEVRGVMHYFQGDESTARQALDLGFFISLARPLLRLPELQEVARKLPLESLVLETDAYPQPFKKYRHNWTEPRHVFQVAEKLAELKGVTTEEVAATTTSNITRLLKLKEASNHLPPLQTT